MRAHQAGEEADRLLAQLAQGLDSLGSCALDGVNPHRPDVDPLWDEQRAAIYAQMVGGGAVHLELGTWTAFPDRRADELIQGDALAEFIRLDLNPDYRPDVVADVTAIPFRSDSIDRVASNSLLEHVAYPQRVLEETFRVLRAGGVMVVVMPFVWMLHGVPDDYVRLTPRYFERICRQIGFEQVLTDVASSGGVYNVLHNTAKMASVDERSPDFSALRELHELVVLLLATLVPLDHGFAGGLNHWFHSVRCLARKPGTYQPSGRSREPNRPFVERTLDLLADPLTGAPLELEDHQLVCREYGHAFEVRAGIPIFTEPRQIGVARSALALRRQELADSVRERMPAEYRRRAPKWLRRAAKWALDRRAD